MNTKELVPDNSSSSVSSPPTRATTPPSHRSQAEARAGLPQSGAALGAARIGALGRAGLRLPRRRLGTADEVLGGAYLGTPRRRRRRYRAARARGRRWRRGGGRAASADAWLAVGAGAGDGGRRLQRGKCGVGQGTAELPPAPPPRDVAGDAREAPPEQGPVIGRLNERHAHRHNTMPQCHSDTVTSTKIPEGAHTAASVGAHIAEHVGAQVTAHIATHIAGAIPHHVANPDVAHPPLKPLLFHSEWAHIPSRRASSSCHCRTSVLATKRHP